MGGVCVREHEIHMEGWRGKMEGHGEGAIEQESIPSPEANTF